MLYICQIKGRNGNVVEFHHSTLNAKYALDLLAWNNDQRIERVAMKTKMSYLSVLFLLLFLVFASAPVAIASPISIANYNFETPGSSDVVLDQKYGTYYFGIADWKYSGTGFAGIWNPLIYLTGGDNYVGYLSNGYISQTLTYTIVPNVMFTLGIDIGNRSDLAFPNYSIALFAGEFEITRWINPITPLSGYFENLSLEYAFDNNESLIGKQLSIVIASHDANQLNFDNIQLTNDAMTVPVPEPGTLLLLGAGLMGLAAIGRQRHIIKS